MRSVPGLEDLAVRLAVLVAIVGLVGFPANAQGQFSKLRREIKSKFEIKNFRFFYNTSGQHAVDPIDDDQNGVPDQVEDVAKQTWVAHKIFVDTLGFQDPLKSERYAKAEFVDVIFLSRKVVGRNGTAYDGLQKIGREDDPDGLRTICFDIASDIDARRNSTPTHEYFHLIQNGYTYFKTRWYTEGMARWSEHATSKGGIGKTNYRGRWPQSADHQRKLFNLADPYGSELVFWNPLAKLCKTSTSFSPSNVSKAVRSLRYSNGKPVLADLSLMGTEFMRDVLVELGKADDVAFNELGYKKWSEDNQKSIGNSPYIYQTVMEVARKHGLRVSE